MPQGNRVWAVGIVAATLATVGAPACGAAGESIGEMSGAGTFPGSSNNCINGPDFSNCPCHAGEEKACYTGRPGTEGVGSCKAGTQKCRPAGEVTYAFGPCEDEVVPTDEQPCTVVAQPPAPVTCPGPLTKWVPINMNGAPFSAITAGTQLVWTGTEVAVFGGRRPDNGPIDNGGLYDPKTDTWRPMSMVGAPSGRLGYGAVWTGSRVAFWGGYHDTVTASRIDSAPVDEGALYDPATDTWTPIPSLSSQGMAGGPQAGTRTVAWTGTELVVFGREHRDGWFYNPTTKSWRPFGGGFGLLGPDAKLAVSAWAGTMAVVWGPPQLGGVAIGARYDDAVASWAPLAASPLSDRDGTNFVWTGSELFVHGGSVLIAGGYQYPPDGAMYDPATDTWTKLPDGGGERRMGTAVWTGCDVLELGGFNSDNTAWSTGMRYTPNTRTWTALPPLPKRLLGHYGQGVVWAGDQLVAIGSGGNSVGEVFAYRLVQ